METVKIGNLEWSTENLNTTEFLNGDNIPMVKTPEAWKKAGEQESPACAIYGFDNSDMAHFGILYNYYALLDQRKLFDSGWRIPTNDDWKNLILEAGGVESDIIRRYTGAGNRIKSKENWLNASNGSNDYGFNAFPAGMISQWGSSFNIYERAYFWSATELNSIQAYYFQISKDDLDDDCYTNIESSFEKSAGLSVRRVKDV